ncbi:MAG TPA: hypothetical protein VM324_08420 [Egibacteraceae bacterium]|jgi:hypothetical protein|nr:hypothetical protein [Egibacteraceae bacterium]
MSSADSGGREPLLGSWARASDVTGVVAALATDTVTLFDPGNRRMAEVSRADLTPLEAGAVTVAVHVDLPVPHGLSQEALLRWVASLADTVVRQRAREALTDAGLDDAVTLPDVRLDVQASTTGGALCLCGARTPTPDGTSAVCGACGRQAVAPPARSDAGDVLGL